MELRKDSKYAIVVPTSMGLRLCPKDGQPIQTAEEFMVQVTSAETNAASIAAYLGLPVKVLTSFVKDSPISEMIKHNLRKRNMAFEGKDKPSSGPWGYRHQINFADSGFGLRGPRVLNDRAGEVGRTLSVDDFNLEKLFIKHGVKILHLSGLICALSPETGDFCLDLVNIAKKNGTVISFDINYRASFWEGRQSELTTLFNKIVHRTDILIGNEEDFQLALGIDGPDIGATDLSDQIANYEIMIKNIKQHYGSPKVIATTLRQVNHANEHFWGAMLWENGNWYTISPKIIPVRDRIGGGDGFAGGLLYALLNDWPVEKWIRFGWASGAYAATLLTDYAQPIHEDEIWSVEQGNARILR